MYTAISVKNPWKTESVRAATQAFFISPELRAKIMRPRYPGKFDV